MPVLAPSKDTDKLTWARWWVAQGWSVFPLVPRDKEPATKNGFKDATQDIDQINLWWSRNPEYNIGGVPPVDHFVVDIDGPTDLEFPSTFEVTTGKGRHLTFRQNPNNPIPHGQKIWPNVDTRCHGKGYVCLPPSVHPSGAVYAITAQHPAMVFPSTIKPVVKPVVKPVTVRTTKTPTEGDSIASVLLKAPDDPTAGDEDMIRVAGYLARYLPDREVFCATLYAINNRLLVPLDDTAMEKKFSQWERHQEKIKEKHDKELDDESRGWLYEVGGTGYSSHVEKSDGTFVVVEFSDFRVTARGVVVQPGKQTFIVDFHRADGSTLEGMMLDTDTLSRTGSLRTWLAGNGMVLHSHRMDKRGEYGIRLMKLLQSQNPPVLSATDYYGYNPESQTFITDDGEITLEGERRPYTDVFPVQNLNRDRSVHYGFEYDAEQTIDMFRRTLALNEPLEMAKIGAWIVMTILKGQYAGRLPGLTTSAFTGSGKSTVYEIVTSWLGFRQEGGKLTAAVFRNFLNKSANAAVWLDDFKLSDEHNETLRAALTTGQETKMDSDGHNGWSPRSYPLRGSIILSDEGNGLLKEKANRDRLLEIKISTGYRTADGETLKEINVSNAAGTLVALLFKHRHHLDELPALMATALDRPGRWRVLLTVGARILSDVLDDPIWYELIKAWADSLSMDTNQASVLIHDVLPYAWRKNRYPLRWGADNHNISIYNPVWYDETSKTYWVNVNELAALWGAQLTLTTRQRQLAQAEAIREELKACGTQGKGKTFGVRKLRYQQLPVAYSAIVHDLCEVDGDDDA